MKRLLITLAILFALIWAPVYAANVFTETFDSLTSGTNITTSNTTFDYVRIGSGGGSITAEQASSGERHMRLGGSESGSLNGVGIQDSLGGSTITTMNFRVKLENVAETFFIGMGEGGMFTTNNTFSTDDLMWGIQFKNGAVEYRTLSWNSTGKTLSADTNYEFHIVANRSGSNIDYGSHSVANGTMDLFIDGILVGDDLTIANNQNATGFRIYQVGSTGSGPYARFDSITIDDTALAPFTPTAITLTAFTADAHLPTLLLGSVLLLGAVIVWRRQRA